MIRKANGEEWELEIEKDVDEDLGIDFGKGLMESIIPAIINVFSALLIRCRRGCVIRCILR